LNIKLRKNQGKEKIRKVRRAGHTRRRRKVGTT
jgi:hypothetical protein